MNKHSRMNRHDTSMLYRPALHIVVIAVLAVLPYLNTLRVPFQFDDFINIVDNASIRSLSNLWPPVGTRWFGFLSFALNYHFNGLDPLGYHLVNILIHIVNGLLVYWFAALLLRSPYFTDRASQGVPNDQLVAGIPLITAILFVSHPVQTQAITYIVQRFASLAALLYLVSVVFYLKARLSRPAPVPLPGYPLKAAFLVPYALALISAVLAMKTKEIAFTLPLTVALVEFAFFSRSEQQPPRRQTFIARLLVVTPFLLTLAIIPLSLVGTNKSVGAALASLSETRAAAFSRSEYLFTQFRVIITYLRLLLFPINQTFDYDYPLYRNFTDPPVLLSFFFLGAIVAASLYLYHRSRTADSDNGRLLRLASFGIFFFFISLSIESSIIPIADLIFEHRLYLPSVGFFVALAALSCIAVAPGQQKYPWMRKVVIPAVWAIILVLQSLTFLRNEVWQDQLTLWKDVVAKNPEHARGYNMIGIAYYERGDIDAAIPYFQDALRVQPDYSQAHTNLGTAYLDKGYLDKAELEYYFATRSPAPDSIDASVLQFDLGNLYLRKKEYARAIYFYQNALKLDSANADIYMNLGRACADMGRKEEANEYYHKAHALNPDKYPSDFFGK